MIKSSFGTNIRYIMYTSVPLAALLDATSQEVLKNLNEFRLLSIDYICSIFGQFIYVSIIKIFQQPNGNRISSKITQFLQKYFFINYDNNSYANRSFIILTPVVAQRHKHVTISVTCSRGGRGDLIFYLYKIT